MDKDLLKLGSEALKKAALNEEAKRFILQNEKLYKIVKRAADRYIAGETLSEAVATIRWLNNNNGYTVTVDYTGESIRNSKAAIQAKDEFVALAKTIEEEDLNASISLDLSHIGLLVSRELAKENLRSVCEATAGSGKEVIINMEGPDRTDQIIDLYKETLQTYPNLGITIQAYLHRSKDDFKELMALKGSIRLAKGAYKAGNNIALPRGNELNDLYLSYAEQLLAADHPCAIASFDEKILDETIKLVDRYQPVNYFLEGLLGIRNEELSRYRDKGYHCRLYLVYGKEWYLYLCHRWAEYPLSLFRGLADVLDI